MGLGDGRARACAGWTSGIKMDLSFHPFEVVVLHLSVLLVAELLRGGTATWFQGSLLLATYSLLAFGFLYLPAMPLPFPPGQA